MVVTINMLFTDLIFERVGAWVVLSKVKVSHLRDSSILPSPQSYDDSKPLIELDFEKISTHNQQPTAFEVLFWWFRFTQEIHHITVFVFTFV